MQKNGLWQSALKLAKSLHILVVKEDHISFARNKSNLNAKGLSSLLFSSQWVRYEYVGCRSRFRIMKHKIKQTIWDIQVCSAESWPPCRSDSCNRGRIWSPMVAPVSSFWPSPRGKNQQQKNISPMDPTAVLKHAATGSLGLFTELSKPCPNCLLYRQYMTIHDYSILSQQNPSFKWWEVDKCMLDLESMDCWWLLYIIVRRHFLLPWEFPFILIYLVKFDGMAVMYARCSSRLLPNGSYNKNQWAQLFTKGEPKPLSDSAVWRLKKTSPDLVKAKQVDGFKTELHGWPK